MKISTFKNQSKDNNSVLFSVSHNLLFSGSSIFLFSVVSTLIYFNSKLKHGEKAISDLQQKSKSLNKVLSSLNDKNQKLMDLLTDLKHKNESLEKLVTDMKTENSNLSNVISSLQENLTEMEIRAAMSPNVTSGFDSASVKIILGALAIGVITYGGFSLANFVTTKYATSSVGLLISGLDKKLTWLGTKAGVIDIASVNQIYLDKFGKKYQVFCIDEKITEILVNSNDTYIEMGQYIEELLGTLVKNQQTINFLSSKISVLDTTLSTPTKITADVMATVAGNAASLTNLATVTEALATTTI
jgi:hypothetical protein